MVEIDLRDRVKVEREPKSRRPSRKSEGNGKKQDGERPKTSVPRFGCGEQGHSLRQSRKGEAGGGKSCGKAREKRAPDPKVKA